MREPIEIRYFNWLCAKVLERDKDDYRDLLGILYDTEFIWKVSADRHRISDAMELRERFSRKNRINRPCSVLEVFIAFADRAAFQTENSSKYWFWKFVSNLGLDPYRQVFEDDIPVINEILYTFIWRIYEPNGEGGMFPLHQTQNDQREIEIWYQFCEWVQEQGLV